jgi:hypothetical protein
MRRLVSVLIALGVLAAPAAARSERATWNQERAAAIASELAVAVQRLKASAERAPEQPSVMQERRRQGVLVDLRRLSDLTADLASRLKAGQGLRETQGVYDEIQTVRRQAREAGRDLFTPESTAADIVTARGMLERLAPYYESP